MKKNQIFKFHFSYSHNTPDNNLWINNITVWEIRHKMVFLILFPSFMPKNDAFLISFKSFFLLFSYSFYLFYSFLMHYGCIFSQTLVELYDYSFFLSRLLSNFLLFTAFLCIMHLISLCFSLIITIFSYYYLYRCTRVNRSFHSSRRFFLL